MTPTCHPDSEHKARGLCEACYSRARRRRSREDYPRSSRTRDELLDDYVLLREQGLSLRLIGERLGMSKGGVYIAVHRARKAGDERAFAWRRVS